MEKNKVNYEALLFLHYIAPKYVFISVQTDIYIGTRHSPSELRAFCIHSAWVWVTPQVWGQRTARAEPEHNSTTGSVYTAG